VKGDTLADADYWKGRPGKLETEFSESPGSGS
jgi:hypothetical protein